MATTFDPIISTRTKCAVCDDADLRVVLDLPDLPLTGRFSRRAMGKKPQGIDQRLLFCPVCSHVQLAYQVAPQELYNETYSFRTSQSSTARNGTEFFLKTLSDFALLQSFECALDVGCNDLHLLEQLKTRARLRVGIDPIWKEKPNSFRNDEIVVIGDLIENCFEQIRSYSPDLIVFRHTLEHIDQPKYVLEKLLACARPGALFFVEVPNFQTLVRRLRFDQIFHQHLQYFSLSSFRTMIESLGATYLGVRENYHDWGAMCVVFKKGKDAVPTPGVGSAISAEQIVKNFQIFQHQMQATNDVLESFKDAPLYGYGAAGMLPVLAYHLKNDLSCLNAVLDDDPAKTGWSYWNLPVSIKATGEVKDLRDINILLTAIDNSGPILQRLLGNRPKHVVFPLNVI